MHHFTPKNVTYTFRVAVVGGWAVEGLFFFKRGLGQTGLLQAGSVGQVTFSAF